MSIKRAAASTRMANSNPNSEDEAQCILSLRWMRKSRKALDKKAGNNFSSSSSREKMRVSVTLKMPLDLRLQLFLAKRCQSNQCVVRWPNKQGCRDQHAYCRWLAIDFPQPTINSDSNHLRLYIHSLICYNVNPFEQQPCSVEQSDLSYQSRSFVFPTSVILKPGSSLNHITPVPYSSWRPRVKQRE